MWSWKRSVGIMTLGFRFCFEREGVTVDLDTLDWSGKGMGSDA